MTAVPSRWTVLWGNTVIAIATTDHRNLWLTIQDLSLIDEANACNVLCKWLLEDFGLTAHSLRHTFRDRLRASGCPLELMDQIGGWSSVGTIGSKYGMGYRIQEMRQYLNLLALRQNYV